MDLVDRTVGEMLCALGTILIGERVGAEDTTVGLGATETNGAVGTTVAPVGK